MPRFPHQAPAVSGMSDGAFSTSSLASRALSHEGPVFALHIGDTYLDPLPAARAEAQRTKEVSRLHNYAPVQGEPRLLDAIEARHDGLIARECLQVTAGATGGLAGVCTALLDPGDEVLLLSPYWPLIRGIISVHGAVAVEVPLFDRLDAPGFDVAAAIEAATTERTVAIYVNTPNNPTGRVLRDADIDAIATIAKRHDLWVISDEAYESLCFTEPAAALWQRDGLRSRTIATHTLSKSHGLAGARVGYTHGPADAMQAVRAVQTFHTYCASRPMQLAAAAAFEQGDAWIAEARDLYAAAGQAAAAAVGAPAPEAGTFLFFNARRFLRDGEATIDLLERCVEEAGVLMTPGVACGAAYEDWVRMCFSVVPPDELEQALSQLNATLSRV